MPRESLARAMAMAKKMTEELRRNHLNEEAQAEETANGAVDQSR